MSRATHLTAMQAYGHVVREFEDAVAALAHEQGFVRPNRRRLELLWQDVRATWRLKPTAQAAYQAQVVAAMADAVEMRRAA